jgi:FKBP-type peptidyl-prolyl cis-trans isomerase 2
MKLKKHDFVEIDYTGRLEDDTVFDTTDEKTAQGAGIKRESTELGPVTICLGENHILKGIEDKIIGSEPGVFKVELNPEEAFGKKNAKLLKLIPMKMFSKEKIAPYPGLEVNVDNSYGIVRSVSGGRVIVDFNHPLAGRIVKYEGAVKNIVSDPLVKAKALFKNELNITDIKLEVADNTLHIEEKIPADVLEALKKRIIELIPDIKDVKLKESTPKKEEKPADTPAKKADTAENQATEEKSE